MKNHKIRITKEFSFEMAHALWNYDGKCKNIHGHSYKLIVTIIGFPLNDESNPKNGMVLDFGELKNIVKTKIIDTHDHALAINSNSPLKDIFKEEYNFDLKQLKSYQPTAENMIIEFAHLISNELPENIKLYSLKLFETATSSAEWFASDNENEHNQ
jgi:6-pyruvoyltetrahydropterin/6-carboxytetrahydropterin synthase